MRVAAARRSQVREVGAEVKPTELATVPRVDDMDLARTVPRAHLRRALTPQSFHFDILKRAYEQLDQLESSGVEVTDDSFLVERLGMAVTLVEGSARNIKITTPEDLAMAEAFLTL